MMITLRTAATSKMTKAVGDADACDKNAGNEGCCPYSSQGGSLKGCLQGVSGFLPISGAVLVLLNVACCGEPSEPTELS